METQPLADCIMTYSLNQLEEALKGEKPKP